MAREVGIHILDDNMGLMVFGIMPVSEDMDAELANVVWSSTVLRAIHKARVNYQSAPSLRPAIPTYQQVNRHILRKYLSSVKFLPEVECLEKLGTLLSRPRSDVTAQDIMDISRELEPFACRVVADLVDFIANTHTGSLAIMSQPVDESLPVPAFEVNGGVLETCAGCLELAELCTTVIIAREAGGEDKAVTIWCQACAHKLWSRTAGGPIRYGTEESPVPAPEAAAEAAPEPEDTAVVWLAEILSMQKANPRWCA